MIRGPQILTWSGLLRPLREFHVAAGCEHTGTGWLGARVVKDKGYKVIHGYKEVPLFSTETLSFSTHLSLHNSNCDNQESGAIFCNQDHHPAQVSPSAKVKLGCNAQKCTAVEDLSQNLKAVSILNSLINTACLQAWRRTTLCNLLQSHSYHRQHFIRAFSLSAHQPWILNRFHCKHKPSSCSLQLTRAACQTPVAGIWRDCLSSENESRCRQSLGPNLKLYETDKGRKWLSRGKNQAKWASVLVSLCSVKGEPAFLFTLRSSMLKGRHKGDVSFAGGKNDPSDRDVVATALREAREELGINVATERVWGILKPLNDVSGMMIAPVLANLGPLEELCFKPNPGEVEEIFTLSLSHLCNPQNRGYTHFRIGDKYGYTLPVFRNGKHRVWGLTAVALDHTLKLIVPRPPSQ